MHILNNTKLIHSKHSMSFERLWESRAVDGSSYCSSLKILMLFLHVLVEFSELYYIVKKG